MIFLNKKFKFYTKTQILNLTKQTDSNIVGIFEKDNKGINDINNQKEDTEATIIVDTEGWRGTNLRASVYEGGAGNTGTTRTGFNLINNNTDTSGQKSGIQEAFTTKGTSGATAVAGGDHATTCTAIITNRGTTVNQEDIPDSLLYNAR